MYKKLIILTITVTFILPLIAAITIYQYNKPVNKNITMVIIESYGISNDINDPLILTTLQTPDGQQYDVYSTCVEPMGKQVNAVINQQNEVIDYKVIE